MRKSPSRWATPSSGQTRGIPARESFVRQKAGWAEVRAAKKAVCEIRRPSHLSVLLYALPLGFGPMARRSSSKISSGIC